MSEEKIRVGIIGAGANTKSKHIPGLQALNNVEIVTVCNRSTESSERVAQEFKIPNVHKQWYDVIYDPEVDAVVIGTWPYLHASATLLALEHEKHVLCEARMAMNAEEAHAMLEASQARPHLVAQLVPSPFTLKVDRVIQRILAEGHVGTPLAVEIRDGGAFLDPHAPLHWRQDFDRSGYNMLSLGIWYECLMRWLGDATDVMARGKTFVKQRRDEHKMLQPVRLPDHVDVIAEMACGAQLHMQLSAVTGLAGPAELFIFGDKGTLRFTDGKVFGAQHGSDHLKEIPVPQELAGKWRVEEEFIRAIRGQEQVKLTTFTDGVKYMEFTEAVFRSIQSGQHVTLPL